MSELPPPPPTEPPPERSALHSLKAIAVASVGAILGAAAWTVGEVVIHGACRVPPVRALFCDEVVPLTGSVGEELGLWDVLGLILFIGIGIGATWKVWIEGRHLLD